MTMKERKCDRIVRLVASLCILLWELMLTKPMIISANGSADLDLYAASAVLIDAESGRVLYEKDADLPMANASTTKIMTCITVLEYCDLSETLKISSYAASQPQVKLGMRKGEEYLVKDLLYSMMLESHNDSACALAEHVGKTFVRSMIERSEESFTREESMRCLKAFCAKMNEKAKQIGCEDTYFITPNGLDATESNERPDGTIETREHHTTAKDLAKMMAYCMQTSPETKTFREITGTGEYHFKSGQRTFLCQNHNRFLEMMQGAVSGKTGFTGKAGYCYVAALERDDKHLIAVLLACGWPGHREYKWADTKKLMQYGLDKYHRAQWNEVLISDDKLPALPVSNGATSRISDIPILKLFIDKSERNHISKGILLTQDEEIDAKISLQSNIVAPIEKGDQVGEVSYLVGGNTILQEKILAGNTIPQCTLKYCIKAIWECFLKGFVN